MINAIEATTQFKPHVSLNVRDVDTTSCASSCVA